MKTLVLAAIPLLALTSVAVAQSAPATSAHRASHAVVQPAVTMGHKHTAAASKRLVVDDAKARRKTRALNLLEAQGYGGFSNFRADGANYEANVTGRGKVFTVTIDPDSGSVTNAS